MNEEEEKTEEAMTDGTGVVRRETIGEEMTDVMSEGIIETVIGSMEEEELEVIIIGEAEIIPVTIVVRMGSAIVIVTVLQENQVQEGEEETEVIEVDMVDRVTEVVGEEGVGAVVEGNKASLNL